MSERLAYTVAETAALLGKSRIQVQRWLLAGELPGTKVGGVWFVPVEGLQARLRGEYDDQRAGPSRGNALPAKPGQALGGDGDDARRPPPVRVRKVQGGGRTSARGPQEAAGRSDGRSAQLDPWDVPPKVAG